MYGITDRGGDKKFISIEINIKKIDYGREDKDMRKRFSDEQVDSANHKDIMEVAKNLGLPLKKEGGSYRVPGNGGFVITPGKNVFKIFSKDEKGYRGGPIQLVMMVEKIPWVKAVAYLLGEEIREVSHKKQIPIPKKEIVIPERNSNYRHMYAYLMKTRKIDKEIIDVFVKEKLLYENTYHSCVFVGYDNQDKIKHCSIRGTVKENAFKGEALGSDKRYAFHRPGVTKTLRVFEAAIDSFSYLSLNHQAMNDHIVCFCCLAEAALVEYLKNHHIEKIIFQLDNDCWGDDATKTFMEKYQLNYITADERPPKKYKDWNQYIVSLREEQYGKAL